MLLGQDITTRTELCFLRFQWKRRVERERGARGERVKNAACSNIGSMRQRGAVLRPKVKH